MPPVFLGQGRSRKANEINEHSYFGVAIPVSGED